MAEYFSSTVKEFLGRSAESIQAKLHLSYAEDGFSSQYTSATKAWSATLECLKNELRKLVASQPESEDWGLILEYPLYRLRIRLDLVLLSSRAIYVIELKTESKEYLSADKRQVEEYALDLRDFHSGSSKHVLYPILWCPERDDENDSCEFTVIDSVASVICVGKDNLVKAIQHTESTSTIHGIPLFLDTWLSSTYKPVPSIVNAATAIFSNHGVREISNFDADNLAIAGDELTKLIAEAKHNKLHYLLLLSGVPGSGKTLAGLNVVHESLEKNIVNPGEIVYLSGNTPLVTVLREALALDQVHQAKLKTPPLKLTLKNTRINMRVTIQHVMDFLNQYLNKEVLTPPVDRVVIFDEAQRAWDKKQGKVKFDREASEPDLILNIMERHEDWSVVIALVGIGQEINDGEYGLSGWGEALSIALRGRGAKWNVFGSKSTIEKLLLAPEDLPKINLFANENLHLSVPQRSYRAPNLSNWIDSLINGNQKGAMDYKKTLTEYPLLVTRDVGRMKSWLLERARGHRRIGLLASSGAKRLRADGFGEFLTANDGPSIAHWYLQPFGDIRSSYALEVPSNEYTSQGLEIDYVGLCWGGDLVRPPHSGEKWIARKLSGNHWTLVNEAVQQFIENSYRVLMTRAREGMIIWVPKGDVLDKTRRPEELDRVYSYLIDCGAEVI